MTKMLTGILLFALLLASVQFFFGVRTDEAKYLLNIPYPHPPLIRTMLGWTDGWTFQEGLWRAVLSVLLLFTGFLFRGTNAGRTGLLLWVTAPAVLLSAGTVMLAPVTAMYASLLLWMLGRPKEKILHPGLLGVLWLAMLFSAYQNLLLAPLFFGLLRKRGTGWFVCKVVTGIPIFLLLLYTAGHPLAAASFILQGGKDAELSALARSWNVVQLWLLAGGGVGTVLGFAGLIRAKNIWVLMSFLLFVLYVFLGSFLYYAIFFTPFFAWGIGSLQKKHFLQTLLIAGNLLTLWYFRPLLGESVARSAVQTILNEVPETPALVIRGPFGHEWQYESPVPVLRFKDGLLIPPGSILICTEECPLSSRQKLPAIPGVFGAWRL